MVLLWGCNRWQQRLIMKNDELGSRIKRYEKVSDHKLLPRTPLIIRVDGKAFHTFTKGAKKPFDQDVIDAMVYAANNTATGMMGFELAYVQSDEATFMLADYDNYETQGWFNYELNKIVSITASAFTAYFNRYWDSIVYAHIEPIENDDKKSPAMFDARAFNMPREDAPNAFVWRQQDWKR